MRNQVALKQASESAKAGTAAAEARIKDMEEQASLHGFMRAIVIELAVEAKGYLSKHLITYDILHLQFPCMGATAVTPV